MSEKLNTKREFPGNVITFPQSRIAASGSRANEKLGFESTWIKP